MSRYRMSDGTVVDTANATRHWDEETDWNGSNHISRATGTQWTHETLYRSRKGRYYVQSTSQWQGSCDSAEWVSNEEATRWLVHNEHDLPDELKALADQVTE